MKKVIFGLVAVVFLISCNKTLEIYDLKEFCDFTIESYKSDNKSEAIELRMKKGEVIAMLNSMKLPDELKKQRLAAVEKQDEEGYFNNTRLEKLYTDFRSQEDNDFWKNCTIEGYEYMKTDKWYGFEMAEPIVILKLGDYTANFKIGEIIKTDSGWKIIQGPAWK